MCKFPRRADLKVQVCLSHSSYLQRNINNVLQAFSVPHQCVIKAADQRKGHKTLN